jgi:hypothetical protein
VPGVVAPSVRDSDSNTPFTPTAVAAECAATATCTEVGVLVAVAGVVAFAGLTGAVTLMGKPPTVIAVFAVCAVVAADTVAVASAAAGQDTAGVTCGCPTRPRFLFAETGWAGAAALWPVTDAVAGSAPGDHT